MTTPPLAELEALAERAVALLTVEGQATVLWRRGRRTSIAFTAVVDGRASRVETEDPSDRALARAARAAGLRAAQPRAWPSAGLPRPETATRPTAPARQAARSAPATSHPAAPPPTPPSRPAGAPTELPDPAARIAIASTHGIRAAESLPGVWHLSPENRQALLGEKWSTTNREKLVDHHSLENRQALSASEVADRLAGGAAVVLGPRAVAGVLDRLRSVVGVDLALGQGPLAGRVGDRVAAACVDLRDDARDPVIGRCYDAEGVTRRAVTIIEHGMFRGGVDDTASAAAAGARSTGHATQPATLAPMPDHLVLARGEAGGIEDLIGDRPETVIYLAALDETADVDPLALLASVEALGSRQAIVPLRAHTPGGTGYAIVPALRATAGIAARA